MAELKAEIQARFEQVVRELESVSDATEEVEARFLKLSGAAVEFDKVTQKFQKTLQDGNDVFRTAISDQEGLNAIGIKTSAQFKQQIRVLLQLRKAYQSDAAVVAQLDRQLESLGAQVGRVNKGARGSSQVFFQAGQAVSDFASAGILGAANNLEVLALQLGASGPVLIGLSALAAAAIVFKDDISAAFSGLDAELEGLRDKTKEVADSLISINKTVKVSFDGSQEELEQSGKKVDEIVSKLEARVAALRGAIGTAQAGGRGPGGATFNALADVSGLQEELDSVLRVLTRYQGIQESINSQVEDEKVLRETIGDIETLGLNRKEEAVKKSREEKTLLEQALEANQKLKTTLESLRNLDTDRLGQILLQNNGLREQIKIVQRIAEEQAKAARVAASSLGGFTAVQGQGLSSQGAVTPIEDIITDIRKRAAEDKRTKLDLPVNLDPQLVDEVTAAYDRQQEAIAETAAQAEQLAGVVAGGLTDAISSFFTAVGSGDDPFTALRQSIGNFAVDLGRTVIGFAIAGDAIKNFVQSAPGVGIAAGAGLIALGSALKKSAQEKTNSFVAGGASASAASGINGPEYLGNDPRRGNQGIERSYEPGYNPISSLAQFSVPEFTFRIMGEDLVAVSDKNTRRQSRTRGR